MASNWADRRIITIDGPIKSADGYGHMTENMILAFVRKGWDVSCGTHWGHTDLTHVNPIVAELARRQIRDNVQVGIRCSQPDSFNIVHGEFKIGYSMFEFTKIPTSWVPGANSVPLNFVPSQWCKEIWQNGGVTVPIEVVQLGVDETLYTEVDRRPDPEVWTYVMSGTMSERKSPWLAWEAFQIAFPKTRRDVRLVMKSPSWLPLPTDIPDDRIVVYNETWPKDRMVQLMHEAHCFVYPTRSEGFGLSPCEAMATGLPVICTNSTSCTEFMREEHAYPLSITGWENVPSHWGDIGAFSSPSKDHLIELLLHVDSHREEAIAKGHLAAKFIRENLTWRHNAEKIVAAVTKHFV